MAGLLDLFSGGGTADLYGDMLSERQRGALGNRGLLALAASLGKNAGPSFSPVPDFGAALGMAAGAYGTGSDAAAENVFTAMLRAQQAEDLKSKAKARALFTAFIQKGMSAPDAARAATAAVAPAGGASPSMQGPLAAPASPSPSGTSYGGLLDEDAGGYGQPSELKPTDILSGPGEGPPPINIPSQVPVGASPPRGGADTVVPTGARPSLSPAAFRAAPGGGLLDDAPMVPGGPDTVVPTTGARPDLPFARTAMPDAIANLVERYESGGRNIMQGVVPAGGGYNPSTGTVTGPSTAQGYYQITDSTWRGAAPKAGVDLSQYPSAMSAPKEVQRKVADHLYDQRGLADWAPYNANLARAVGWTGGSARGGPDTVVPTGDGSSLPVMQAQFSGQLQPRGAPGGPERLTPDGKIPGFNLTPAEAAQADALAEISGLGNPLKGILETYYKSPGYLGEAAGATEAGRRAVADPAEIRLKTIQSMLDQSRSWAEKGFQIGPDGKTLVDIPGFIDTQTKMTSADAQAREKARVDAQKQLDQNKAELDRVSKAQEQLGAAGLTPMTVDVLGADGRTQKTQMSQLEFAKRQADKAKRDAAGVPPQPGDVVGTPVFNEFEKGIQTGGVKTFNDQRDAALTAAKNIDWNNESLKLLDSGMYTGVTGPLYLEFNRIFGTGGKDNVEKIQNTQKFLLERAQQVAAQVRAQPGSASDKDLAFAQKVSLGDITLDEGTIRDMLEIYNKYNRKQVEDFNSAASNIRPDVLGGIPLKVPLPQLKPMDETTRAQAADAIKNKAPPGAVRNRLRQQGFDPSGL